MNRILPKYSIAFRGYLPARALSLLALILVLAILFSPAFSLRAQAIAPAASSVPTARAVPVAQALPASSSAQDEPKAPDSTRAISLAESKEPVSIGDSLRYRVIEDRDPPVQLVVMSSGEISVPYLGRIKAAGKTCDQLAAEIKPLLEKTYYNRATVVIALEEQQAAQGHVLVVGAVNRPGPVPISPGETLTVSKVIVAAGGLIPFGSEKVKLVRKNGDDPKDRKEFTIDVGAVLKKGLLEKDMEVMNGDMIIVSEKLINFH